MDAHHKFTGPPFNTQLSPPDQAAVSLLISPSLFSLKCASHLLFRHFLGQYPMEMFPYPLFCLKQVCADPMSERSTIGSPRILVFSLPQNSDNAEIVSILQDGVQETINQFPVLAGSCTQPPLPRNGEKQGGLRYHNEGEAHLRVKDLSVKYDLEKLRKSHFSQEKLLPEDLCPTPGFDYPAMRQLELFNVQANFVKNGPLLVVCMYHSICDSVSQFHITEMLASQCNAIQSASARLPARRPPSNSPSPPTSSTAPASSTVPQIRRSQALLLRCAPSTREGHTRLSHAQWQTPCS